MSKLKPGFGRLATMGEAFDVLYEHLPTLDTEKVSLRNALHRVTGADLAAEIDVPHFLKASMDGYAVAAADTFEAGDSLPRTLRILGSVDPGQVDVAGIAPGECLEIGTGAAMPPGADAVVMVEYTEPAGADEVLIRKAVAPGENTIRIGSDIKAGSVVVEAGTRLEPRHLGVPAALGITTIEVFRSPTVALFSTGPEIIPAGGPPRPGLVFDINTYTLRAALQVDGCSIVDMGVVPDDLDALVEALNRGLEEADFVLLSGGSSLGGGDLVVEAFEAVGRLFVHGVAVKPGKPLVLAGAVPPGETQIKMLIGLPGYPMSALSDYYIFVQPYIRKAMGMQVEPAFHQAILARKHPSTVGRYEFVPVKLSGDTAHPLTKGSFSISALAEADGFIEVDENTEVVEEGTLVRVRLF